MKLKKFSCKVHQEIITTRKGIREHLKEKHIGRALGLKPNIKKQYLNRRDLIMEVA